MQTGSADQSVLELKDIEIRYGGTPVVANASFNVQQGEFVTLLGPSGSGKTSLLRAIAGFVKATAGQVLLRGVSMAGVPPYERDIGMVFQNYALFPHMTIAQNLSFGPSMMKISKEEINARIWEALAQVRLEKYSARYPHELSGGQQQRVAIARALAMRPSLILLDEPMSNLDARLRAEMRVELVALLKRAGMTGVAVTHNQEEALAMSDRIIVMAEGGIRQVGTPDEIYTQPADSFVANFVGDANVLDAMHVGFTPAGHSLFRVGDADFITVVGDPRHCEKSSRLLVRPESITLCDASQESAVPEGTNRVQGRLVSTAYMGSFIELRAEVGPHEIMVKLPAGSPLGDVKPGEPVVMQWDFCVVKALLP